MPKKKLSDSKPLKFIESPASNSRFFGWTLRKLKYWNIFFFETLFKEETTSLVSDFHVGPPYKNKLITTIIIKYSKYKN